MGISGADTACPRAPLANVTFFREILKHKRIDITNRDKRLYTGLRYVFDVKDGCFR